MLDTVCNKRVPLKKTNGKEVVWLKSHLVALTLCKNEPIDFNISIAYQYAACYLVQILQILD